MTTTLLTHTEVIDGRKWIRGRSLDGQIKKKFLVIGDHPSEEESKNNSLFSGQAGNVFFNACNMAGFDCQQAYFTAAVKYIPDHHKPVSSKDIKRCRDHVLEEIRQVEPEIIVCLGAPAVKSILGTAHKLSDYKGAIVAYPENPEIKVLTTYSPLYVLRNPSFAPELEKDLSLVAGAAVVLTEKATAVRYETINCIDDVIAFCSALVDSPGEKLLCLDCEWHGKNWMDPERYLRTIQISYDDSYAVIIEVTDVGGVPIIADTQTLFQCLKLLLEDLAVKIFGQNVISDGEWLLSYGVDIRQNVVYDTMLAEHVINEQGPFGLEMLTTKYTEFGRYDLPLVEWIKSSKENTKNSELGYGYVPKEILYPYCATDVIGPRQIRDKQIPALQHYQQPRDPYPSLWDIELLTQAAIYELEITGLLVDQARLDQLTEIYSAKLTQLETGLQIMAAQYGMETFNYRSVAQVKILLFEKLGLTPIKTTGGKRWDHELLDLNFDAQMAVNPSTDKNTLEILQFSHPIVRTLLNVRRLDMAVKYFLSTKISSGAKRLGGIRSNIWPDGRIHPRFSQLSETGRFKTSAPNCQNFPKKAEGYMKDIFGADVPSLLRTVIIPAPGHVFMEADFVQAELFVLAALSGDRNMMAALTTPGKDLHDLTAISSFGLTVVDDRNTPVSENDLITLATNSPEMFKELQQKLIYIDQKGKRLTRDEFKNGLRVSSKNLNFGIPYGRGAETIARQVKGETGTETPMETLIEEIEQMMTAWKTVMYADAWKFMMACADSVIRPGYLESPWGRRRHFQRTTDQEVIKAMRREAQNFPIQSTVADTCLIALYLIRQYRKTHQLHFKIVNQIHDAVMLEVPENEIDQTNTMFSETMGSIDIPLPEHKTLRLNIDIDVSTRWGEKQKKE